MSRAERGKDAALLIAPPRNPLLHTHRPVANGKRTRGGGRNESGLMATSGWRFL